MAERTYEFEATIKVTAEPLTDAEVLEVKAALSRTLSAFACGLQPLGRGKGYAVYAVVDGDSVVVQEVHRTATGKALRDEDFERLADEAEYH